MSWTKRVYSKIFPPAETKALMGIVTEHLRQLIAKQVNDRSLVVWYDPERHYADVSCKLALPDETVECYDGSFFALRHRIGY